MPQYRNPEPVTPTYQVPDFQRYDMEKYSNRNGNSGIEAYDIVDSGIIIRFAEGGTYLYPTEACGKKAVTIMQLLAKKGIGLATYINQNIRNLCPQKLD